MINGDHKSGSAAISYNQSMQRTHVPHLLQLLKPKRFLAQPWLNGDQKSGFAAISYNQSMQRAHVPHLLQLLKPKRLLAQPLFFNL
jgi:hypothetical protein